MTCYEAPACRNALKEATKLWPNRGKLSDGICASSDHSQQNPNSDHEPNIVVKGKGYATAFDLTDDPVNGCDADQFAEDLRTTRDPRVKYVICNRRMFSSYSGSNFKAWEWRRYTGSNPHETHTHVSILSNAIFNNDPWFGEEVLQPDEREALLTVNHFVENILPDALKKINEVHDAIYKGHPEFQVPGMEGTTKDVWEKVVKGK